MTNDPIRVGVSGYGAIGKRVADAVVAQQDMILVGVVDVAADWRTAIARVRGIALFGSDAERTAAMREAGLEPSRCSEPISSDAREARSCDGRRTRGRATSGAS